MTSATDAIVSDGLVVDHRAVRAFSAMARRDPDLTVAVLPADLSTTAALVTVINAATTAGVEHISVAKSSPRVVF